MSWDVVHSLVKHGELPTSYLGVAMTLKATSHEFLRHLTSLLRHSYEYPRVPTTYIERCHVELVGHYNSSNSCGKQRVMICANS